MKTFDKRRSAIASARSVESVTIPGPAGSLDGLWSDPGRGLPAVVICHPHPAHAGSMHSKVVHAVYRALEHAGHPTLRFDFRGVGLSHGRYSGGSEEVWDVAAAARFARARTGRQAVWAAGFSFGAWVGLQWALTDADVGRFIALGLPVDNHSFEFLNRVPWPLTIVQGERDQYGSPPRIRALRERLGPEAPVTVRLVPGADHFFTGMIEELKQVLEEVL